MVNNDDVLDSFYSTHFWGPVANWAIPIAALADIKRDPKFISGKMTFGLYLIYLNEAKKRSEDYTLYNQSIESKCKQLELLELILEFKSCLNDIKLTLLSLIHYVITMLLLSFSSLPVLSLFHAICVDGSTEELVAANLPHYQRGCSIDAIL